MTPQKSYRRMSRQERHRFDDAAPFKINGFYCKLIPLTKGQYAIVLESDYEWLMRSIWCARWNAKSRTFYVVRHGPEIDGKQSLIYMHRQILGIERGSAIQVDHRNPALTLVNTRDNLRFSTVSQNSMNTRAHRDSNTGLKGIYKDKRDGMYTAMIMVNGKRHYLGRRKTAQEAYKLRCDAAPFYHGDFARNK